MTVKPLQKYAPSVIKEKNSVPKMQVYNSAFRNRYGQFTFEEAVTNPTEWGRQVESAVGAHLTNRSLLDGFELLYWRDEHKKECDYVLKKGQALVAIEVKSSSADDTSGFEKFRQLYAEQIMSAFIVGPEGLPLEDFFSLDINQLFRKK
jgi:predicted AAA+ superfamily ATPase